MSTMYGGDSGVRTQFPASSVQQDYPDGHFRVEEPLPSSPAYFPGQEQLSQPLFLGESPPSRSLIGKDISGPDISGSEAQRLDGLSDQNGAVNSSWQGVPTLPFDD